MRDDDYWVPRPTSASDEFETSIYDIVYRNSPPRPYTSGGMCDPDHGSRVCAEGEADPYAKALADVASRLGVRRGLRQADIDDIDWSG